jgi:hypothetical protein
MSNLWTSYLPLDRTITWIVSHHGRNYHGRIQGNEASLSSDRLANERPLPCWIATTYSLRVLCLRTCQLPMLAYKDKRPSKLRLKNLRRVPPESGQKESVMYKPFVSYYGSVKYITNIQGVRWTLLTNGSPRAH